MPGHLKVQSQLFKYFGSIMIKAKNKQTYNSNPMPVNLSDHLAVLIEIPRGLAAYFAACPLPGGA
jgi:hypothetical protein